MADAPKSDSGSSFEWGFFEILVVVVIFIAVLNSFSKNDTTQTNQTTNTAEYSNTKTVGNCSITVNNPLKDQKLTGIEIPVNGTFSNCVFNDSNTVLYGQLIDSKGMILSTYTPITKTNDDYSFSGNITLTGDSATKKGILIFVLNVPQEQNTTQTIRIPVLFPTN